MTEISSFFTQNYQQFLQQLTKIEFENFKNLADDRKKIKLFYPYLSKLKITPAQFGKDFNKVKSLKDSGNLHFSKNEIKTAIIFYSQAILQCPQTNFEEIELLSILIANRSACWYELKKYNKALNDIEYVAHIKAYPEHLRYKLFIRKAKCFCNIKLNLHLAAGDYERAKKYLDLSKLNTHEINRKKQEIDIALKLIPSNLKIVHTSKAASKDFQRNHTFPNASSSVRFDYEENLGRYATASTNISAGTIIINESAHCAVLSKSYMLTNCQYCMKATDAPIACQTCANVVFCSISCLKNSNTYHQFECGLHPTMFDFGASINCLMALRMITQQSLQYFESKCTISKEGTIFFEKPEIHEASNYACVYGLCCHKNLRKSEEYFHYTIMAIYLLRILKSSSYFNNQQNAEELTNSEILICMLILHNLQLLQFNAHEISELREAPPGPLDPVDKTNYKALYIGGGIYPTLALFNHSCDPSIVRYNVGSKVIVRTIKPINKGDIIYENYGPIYTNTILNERKKFLLDRYWFDCNCQACTEDWKLFKDMNEYVIQISCSKKECARVLYIDSNVEEPFVTCSKCNTVTNLLSHIKALMELENVLPQAESLYNSHNYEESIKLYLKAINYYYKHTRPPFPDWVKVQQRLRTCMVSLGNKSISYKQ